MRSIKRGASARFQSTSSSIASALSSSQLHATTPDTRVAEDLFDRCITCHSVLHEDQDSMVPGAKYHSHKGNRHDTAKMRTTRRFQELFESLDEDKRNFLLQEAERFGALPDSAFDEGTQRVKWLEDESESLSLQKKREKDERKAYLHEHLCQRCLHVKWNKPVSLRQPFANRQEYMNYLGKVVPPGSTIVHVIDAKDYPLTLDRELMEFAKLQKCRLLFVIHRSDKIHKAMDKTDRAWQYFVDDLTERVGPIDPENIILTSVYNRVSMRELFAKLGKYNYLVGFTNAGKTRIMSTLDSVHPGPTLWRDKQGAYKDSYSSFPWQTQALRTHEFDMSKFITDLPSAPEPDFGGFHHIRQTRLREIDAGRPFIKKGASFNTARLVADKKSEVVSLAGIVVVERPENPKQHLISWPVGGSMIRNKVYSSLQKVKELTSIQENKESTQRFVMNAESHGDYDMKEMTIGKGGLQIAIRGYGAAHFAISGPIPDEGVKVKVHFLKGIRIEERRDLRLIYETRKKQEQKEQIAKGQAK